MTEATTEAMTEAMTKAMTAAPTAVPTGAEVSEALGRLVAGGALPAAAQAAAERLLRRLTSPLRVALCGPAPSASAVLLAQLTGQTVSPEAAPASDLVAGDAALGGLRFEMAAAGLGGFGAADIVLWVTHSFEAAEAEAWNAAPDSLKDHSFLVAMGPPAGLDASLLAHLQASADEGFVRLIGPGDGGEAGASAALRRCLIQQLRSGKEAAQDSAQHLLATFGHLADVLPPIGAAAAVPQAAAAPALASESVSRPEPRIVAGAEPHPAPGPAHSSAAAPGDFGPLYTQAAALIEEQATAISALPLDGAAPDVAPVLELCSQTADALADIFSGRSAANAGFAALKDDVLTAADSLMLMALEETAGSAVDAVTVLLQLRKDFCQQSHDSRLRRDACGPRPARQLEDAT